MAAQEPELFWREFAGEFVQEMIGGVARSAGRSWRVSSIDSYRGESPAELAWLRVGFSGSIDGSCVLGISRPDVITLCNGLRGGEKEQASLAEEECLAEAFAALAPELSAAARNSYGSFTVSVAVQSDAPLHDQSSLSIQLHDDRSRGMRVVACVAPKLIEGLARAVRTEETESCDRADPGAISNESLSMRAPNLDLLMDVELDVTLRFGQRHLTLKEVLDLTSGSVIELDRQVEEPVELILDGKVIARGEAVVIDGNYGLRVTEVPQPLTNRQVRM